MAETKVKKTVKAKVIWLLKNFPDLRDDKCGICKAVWIRERESYHKRMNKRDSDILNLLVEGILSSPETICRWWRKVQAENPQLRGKEYNYRHNIEEPIARETFRHEQ